MVAGAIRGPVAGSIAGFVVSYFVGPMLTADSLAEHDQILRHYENMEEAERILQEARDLNRRLDELCRRTGGCYEDDPCG